MQGPTEPTPKRRGAAIRPQNRFLKTEVIPDFDAAQAYDDDEPRTLKTEVIEDRTRTIVTRNKSPDLGFEVSVNPYRGCEHGCAYCFARPTHEALGYDAGLDFETKIVVKPDAPALLREALAKPNWTPCPIVFSGVTDCYQPLERRFRLTRGCLEACRDFRNPVSIITKNVLVLRDLDLLEELAERRLVRVHFSVTTLSAALAKKLEPRTPPPEARLEAVRRLVLRRVPVTVMVAPVIPGLTDAEVPAILKASAEAGADSADYVLLRLPHTVEPVFFDWLERHFPDRKRRVETLLRDMRGGKLYDSSWGQRQRGTGAYAAQLAATFKLFARRYGLDREPPPLDVSAFRRPPAPFEQTPLFPDL